MTEKKPGIDLKPCPFCGGPAYMHDYLKASDSWEYRIDCANKSPHGTCKGIATTGYCDSQEEAASIWNTRATDEQHAKELEEAFEAGKQRGVFEVVELNYTYDFNVDNPPPRFDDYKKQRGE